MRLSLQAKMFLIFALVATLPLLAMSYLAVGQAQDAFREEVGRSHQDGAANAAGFVHVYVQSALVHVDAEAQSPRLRDALAAGDRAALLLEAAGFQQRARAAGEPLFSGVVVLDEAGQVVAAHPDAAAPVGAQRDDWLPFVAARARGNATALLPETPSTGAVLPMSAPVFVDGRFAGALVANMSYAGLGHGLASLAQAAPAQVLLADAQGRLLVDPGLDEPEAWSALAPLERARGGESGYLEFDLPGSGARALAGFAPLPAWGWSVVSFEPADAAYAGVSRLTAVLVVLAADLLVAMLLASVVVSRIVVRPVRRLTEAADAMAKGRLGTRIDSHGDDEMGDLARTFNVMAERVGSNVEEARRSEERYRSLVESANDLIFSVEPDGTLSFVSALAERVFGEPPAALVGTPAIDRVHPDDRSVFATATSSVLASGRPLAGVQYRIVHRDGTHRVVLTNLSPVMTRLDVPDRVLGVSRDVTDEREQERLRERTFEMARVVSEQAEVEPLLARGLEILLHAAKLERGAAFLRRADALKLIAARRLPPLQDTSFAADLMPHPEEPLQEVYERSAPEPLARHGVQVVFAVPLIERAQTLGLVLLLGSANATLDAPTRQALAALASQLAVGVRRSDFASRLRGYASELETKVAERTAMLLEKSQEMETFLYSVSHDLKAPLISIEGYAQGLEEDYAGRLDEEGRHYVERIRANAELMESLIGDLLEFSRIGRVRETLGPVELDVVLRDIARRTADAFAEQGGRLTLHEPLPSVHAEPKRVAQLFSNLVHNALKYRHPDRPPLVDVRARVEGDDVVVEVEDNGRGMPENARDKAFQIFQRFVEDGMPDPGGTGMGLAIVKRIAETHGGRVDYASRPGAGTTFRVTLPSRPRARAAAPREGGPAP